VPATEERVPGHQEMASRSSVQCLQEASLPRRLDSIVQPEVLARVEIVTRGRLRKRPAEHVECLSAGLNKGL
jgi:hypothetical protein